MSRSSRIPSPVLLVLASTFAAGQAAQADDTPAQPQTAAMLQEVVVTAQKRQEKLINVPMGVTAITSQSLQSMHLVDFADLETQVPGLSVEPPPPTFAPRMPRRSRPGAVSARR